MDVNPPTGSDKSLASSRAASIPAFLTGGGEAGALLRALDWSATPLGAPDAWPTALGTLVGLMLGSNQAMFVVWGPGRTLLYNDHYAEILAAKHPAAMGRDFLEVWREIRADLLPIVEQAYRGEPVQMDDITLTMERRGFREETHFSFFYSPIRDAAGAVPGFFCACTEITAQVLTERRAAAERERQRLLLQHMPGFCALLSGPEHRYEYVNDAYVEFSGERGFVGRTVREVFPDIADQGFYELLDRVYATGERFAVHAMPIRLDRRPDGTGGGECFIDLLYEPVRDDSGRVAGIFVGGHDVTERVRGEARFRRTADTAPALLWVTDTGNRCTYLSRSWYETTGQTPEEALGFGWLDASHPEDRERSGAIFLAAAARREPFQLEYRLRQADGTYRWAIDAGRPHISEAGEYLGYVGSVIDIHERVVAETEVQRHRAELERRVEERTRELVEAQTRLAHAQRMEALGQLAGGIAHDFNNMLQGVTGALAMARRRMEGGSPEGVARYLDAANDAALRAAGLTRRLLAFARRQRLEPRRLNPDVLVAGMAEIVRRTVGPAIAVELRLGAGAGVVRCDPNELESAVLNLCLNARDAMPQGGRLTLATADRRLSRREVAGEEGAAPGPYVEIRVEDTGTGMTPEVLARVTEPFFTTKPQGQGTGLGLSQVYGFARQSGGLLRIESAPGRGTTVQLLLPRRPGQATEEVEHPPAPGASKDGGTVLLVDDEPGVRGPAAERLRELGLTVVEAADGPEAIRRYAEGPCPDMLVTDVGLPGGMNGRQVAEALRERCPGLPVLFISGWSGDVLSPGVEVIGKPFELDELARRVLALLGREGRGGDGATSS